MLKKMHCVFNQSILIVLIVTCAANWVSAEGVFCNSCGEECADACGTRFFRTCCFNYLRKRSSPFVPRALEPQSLAEMEDINIWMNKAELERIMRNEMMREQNINHLDLNQKSQSKDEFQKSTPSSNTNQISHDQMRVIYEV